MKFVIAMTLVCAFAMPVVGQTTSNGQSAKLITYSSPMLPPDNYKGQWWTSPQACEYSRAGRPGETVWYLISNTAHAKCPVRLIQRAYSDYN
ncbi:hypothetical protein [Roseobacter weihaiensis]|uniref:hypothetical protein n=1 Tax=Roseobacter weihaiensis TaxID=2763262 RepID=UPI001D09E185|nr:hypothetical protein [Roseobacter sp. H9]